MAIKFLNTVQVDTDVLYVGATSDNVGIGTNNPSTANKLQINGQLRVVGAQVIGNSNVANVAPTDVQLHLKNSGSAAMRLEDSDSSNLAFDLKVDHGDGFSIIETIGGDAGNDTRLFIEETTGNVGIGTSSPGAKLDVDGDVLIKSGEYISWGTVGATSIEGSTASNKLQFRTNSSDRMIINSSGNVGIGTTSPNHKLDIYSNENIPLRVHRPSNANLNSGGAWGIGFSTRGDATNSTTDTRAGIFSYYNGNLFLAANNSNIASNPYASARLTILNSGNVEINNGQLSLGGTGRIQGVDTVSANTDAANKAYVDSEIATRTPLNDIRSLGVEAFTNGTDPNITTAQVMNEIDSDGGFDSYSSVFKTSWSYAGNYNLTDAGRFTETAGSSWITWTDNSSDSTRGNVTTLAIAPNTGGSAGKVFIYNNQGGSYAPGWREVWTSTSDGAGSGLDADLLDGQQGSYYAAASSLGNYLPVNNPTFTGTLTGPKLSIQNQINTTSTNLEINYENGDGTTANFKDLYIRDGKNSTIASFNGSSKSTTLQGNLSVGGNSFLGNSNGDYVHVNDRLFVGATDSGNAEFWFGEGTTGDVNYGAHWHWDSLYTHKWFTVNNSSETLMMSYATNDTSKVNWYRDIDIQDNDILVDSSHGFVNSGPWTRNSTPSGYIDFGPANTSHAHIYTDRPNFYFNKELYVNNQRVYNTGFHPEADKWTTARTLTLTGYATGSVSWDGSGNVSMTTAVAKIKAGGNGPSTEDLNSVANSVSVGQLEYRGFNSSSTNAPAVSDNANGVITVGQHAGNYNAQLAFSSNGNMYWRDNPSSTNGSWRKMWDSGNDGSGSGLDADLLDGQQGSYYAPASSLGNYLPLVGGTMSGNINMGDNDVTGIDDLIWTSGTRLMDEGSTNYLTLKYANSGAGGIKVVDNDVQLQGYLYGDGGSTSSFGLLDGTGSWAVRCLENQYVELRYDNAIKLRTESAGISVTGNATASGDMSADQFFSTNNGGGQNYKLGDDAWIGDINVANTMRISGNQNASIGYITFGNSSNTQLGRSGTGPLTWGDDVDFGGELSVTDAVLSGKSFSDPDIVLSVTDEDTTESLRNKITNSSALTKVSDATAPAPGCFQVSGSYYPQGFGPYYKISEGDEFTFEFWIKWESGTSTSNLLYAGSNFYNAQGTYLGNSQRYWGEAGLNINANSSSGWTHVSGTLGPDRNGNTHSIPTSAESMRLLFLFNYAPNGTSVTRYCGLKVYKSNPTVTKLYRKTLGSEAGSTRNRDLVIDSNGDITANNLAVQGGSVVLSGNGRIQGVDTVSASTDAANKAYVDTSLGNYLPLAGGSMTGNIQMNNQIFATAGNYGRGVFGLYSASKYQHVWSMGTAYKLADNGDSSGNGGNLYGLAWSYNPNHGYSGSNVQSKPGLQHQLLLMMNGVTRTALGNGIWTSGDLSVSSNSFLSGYLKVTGDIRGNGQQLVLNAGESSGYASGQTSEYVYANAENGLVVSSSPDNWGSGWAGRNTAHINNANGDSTFPGNVAIGAASATAARKLHVHGHIETSGSLWIGGNFSTASEHKIKIGQNRSGNGYAYIDLIGDAGAGSNYNLRIIRHNSGANALSQIIHTGTGNFEINGANGGDIILNSSGNIGISNTSPSYKLDVSGNGRFTSTVKATNFILSSDERLKENIEKVCDNRVKADWKTFELKTDKGQKRYGVIAQELEKTNPEFVREDSQGFKSVAYIDLLIAKIAELEARLEKLEK